MDKSIVSPFFDSRRI